MSMDKKIAIIIVWQGKLPEYHKLWAESIKFNPYFDWFLFTNDTNEELRKYNLSIKNLNQVYFTMNDIYNLIVNKCDVNVDKNFTPYKICDFRPMFGKMFEDYLVDYDFWAWGDNDVIYGNLFYNLKEKFNFFDIIGTGTSNRCSGPLCFFRNTNFINNIYKKIDPSFFKGHHKAVDEGIFSKYIREKLSRTIKLDLSYKAHPLNDCVIWYRGNFYTKNNNIIFKTHFHYGGGKRKKLQKNLITCLEKNKVVLPCDGIKFLSNLSISYYNQKI